MEVPFPSGREPGKIRTADWVEFQALDRRHAFKRGDLTSAIAIEDIKSPELLEERVWEELELRSATFGSNWPLRLNGSRISRARPSPVNLNYYRYLLCIGMGHLDAEDRQLFELLVAAALRGLTGQPSMHLGAPASAGMDSSFRQRVATYAAASGLVDEHEVISPPLSHDKDLGLDVVSWQPFEDDRSGYLHFLAQCATGEDWDNKFDDLHLDIWKRHIHWAVTPVRVFSVPITITELPERWVRLCTRAGLILDRPRLMELDRRRPLDATLRAAVNLRLKELAAA